MTKEEAIDLLINKFCIEDFIYDIRSKAGEGIYEDVFPLPAEGIESSWDHPAVLTFAEAIEVLRS